MRYRIKEVADLAGVSVRTLHHYDNIGLLNPTSYSAAGYRLYAQQDLERLQQILFFKELGFDLIEIKEILDNPAFDRHKALNTQKQLLMEKKTRLEAIIRLVEQALQTIGQGGIKMTKERFQAFDMSEIEKHQKEYAQEARRKYGHTSAYRESQQKASSYSKEDWAAITANSNAIHQHLASLMDKPPDNPEVQEAISQWRQHITTYFYHCTLEIFRGLGDLYVSDERFTANIDKFRPGLAQFMQAAMHCYCDRQKD